MKNARHITSLKFVRYLQNDTTDLKVLPSENSSSNNCPIAYTKLKWANNIFAPSRSCQRIGHKKPALIISQILFFLQYSLIIIFSNSFKFKEIIINYSNSRTTPKTPALTGGGKPTPPTIWPVLKEKLVEHLQ
jgi:hypothetical protein